MGQPAPEQHPQQPAQPAQQHARQEAAPQINILDQNRPQPAILPNRPETHYYRETTNQANFTGHALETSLMNLSRTYLGEGEVRRMSMARAGMPFLTGIACGLQVAGDWMQKIPMAGAIVGLMSPLTSVIRRVTGENAFSQFARFANRAEDRGLFSRLMHGGESRAVKAAFLREDHDVRQLMRLLDQGTQPDASDNPADANYWNSPANQTSRRALIDRLNVGSRDSIDRLIAAGVMAEMKAQLIAENNIQLSKRDHQIVDRYHKAYEMAKLLFDAKIPTPGQKTLFANYQLPNLLRGMEQRLWASQTARVTGVGMIKAGTMALLGHMISGGIIGNLATSVISAGADFSKWITGGIPVWKANAEDWVDYALNQPRRHAAEMVGGVRTLILPEEVARRAAVAHKVAENAAHPFTPSIALDHLPEGTIER